MPEAGENPPLQPRREAAHVRSDPVRRDARRATLYHYRHALIVAAWLPAVAIWSYLAVQLLP